MNKAVPRRLGGGAVRAGQHGAYLASAASDTVIGCHVALKQVQADACRSPLPRVMGRVGNRLLLIRL